MQSWPGLRVTRIKIGPRWARHTLCICLMTCILGALLTTLQYLATVGNRAFASCAVEVLTTASFRQVWCAERPCIGARTLPMRGCTARPDPTTLIEP